MQSIKIPNQDCVCLIKEKVGDDQEMAQPERKSHSKNRGGKKFNTGVRTYIEKIYRKPSEQLFSNRRSLSYPNLTKNMNTYIWSKQKIQLQNIKQLESL